VAIRMRLAAFLLLASATVAFQIPTREEKVAAWSRLTTVKDFKDGVPDELKMVFVNTIWRHGDRGPTGLFPGDKLTEEDWDFGGGGYGELSPIGMRQHYELGMKLYDRYAADDKFLSSRYRAKEIYVRSTDSNRTVISAMSNFAGMYSRPTAINGTDFPEIEEWPTNFVPIPIHMPGPRSSDHVGDPESRCARYDDLWDLAHQHPEYIAFNNKARTQQTLDYLRQNTNSNADDINFDNVNLIAEGMLCESIHFPDNFSTWYPWYSEDVKQRTTEINNQNIDFENGIFGSGMIQGYDLTLEMPPVRGGSLLNDVVDRANGVLDCYVFKNNLGGNTRCSESDHFLSNLKYYVLSAHDTTIGAFLTVLEAKPYVIANGGYSAYSSAVILEFFIDTANGNDRKFRVLFHDDENSDFRVITPMVGGCLMGEDFCSISHLQELADKYAPKPNIDELCAQRINGPAELTTVVVPVSSTSPTPSTTKKGDDGTQTTITVPAPPSTTSPSSLFSCLSATAVLIISKMLI
ncbi:hypothetical protein PENTCL1PPCAC_8924, partial [Pristionchus entomophagus]